MIGDIFAFNSISSADHSAQLRLFFILFVEFCHQK